MKKMPSYQRIKTNIQTPKILPSNQFRRVYLIGDGPIEHRRIVSDLINDKTYTYEGNIRLPEPIEGLVRVTVGKIGYSMGTVWVPHNPDGHSQYREFKVFKNGEWKLMTFEYEIHIHGQYINSGKIEEGVYTRTIE